MNFTIFLFDQRAAVYQKTAEGYSNFRIKGESIYEFSTDSRAVDVLPDYILSSNHHGIVRLEIYKLDWHESELTEWRQKLPGTDILFLDLNVFELFRSDMLQEKEDIFQQGLSELNKLEHELAKTKEKLSEAKKKQVAWDELRNQNDENKNKNKNKQVVFFNLDKYKMNNFRFIGVEIMLSTGFKVKTGDNVGKAIFNNGFRNKFKYLKAPRNGYIHWLNIVENSFLSLSFFKFKDSQDRVALAVITDARTVDQTALHQYVKDFYSKPEKEV